CPSGAAWDVQVLRDRNRRWLVLTGSQIWYLFDGHDETGSGQPLPWYTGELVLLGWVATSALITLAAFEVMARLGG
ncbi:hypothetical protein, partial [Micropruina sp.]|uniref:hypothetical protein n=1 Tax=Micropruina sp. TaxID=2737536 RepID=UPI002636B8D8